MARIFTAAAAASLCLLSLAAPANAQFLTYVSATGNDANTCFVQAAPCQTLQRGINQTSAGGELRLLSRLSGNGIVNKSMTVDGGGYTVIGTISMNSASAIVAFRRLDLNGRHAFATGLNIISAAAVHIEHCTIERYTTNGISLAANAATELSVSDSTVSDNGQGISVANPSSAKLMIADSVLANNSNVGLALEGGFAAIVRSTVSGSTAGAGLVVVGATLVARDTTLASNGENLNVGSGGIATLKSVTLRDAGASASSIFVSAGGLVRLATSVLTNNDVAIDNGGLVQTLEDNILDGNGTDVDGNALDTDDVEYQ